MNIQKEIFKGCRQISLGGTGLLLAVLFAWVPLASAGQTLHYRTYHPKTGEEFNRFDCVIQKISSGGYQVHWTIDEAGSVTQEDYILGAQFDTLRFRVVNTVQKTELTGERKGDVIHLRGQFKGEKIEKALQIDGRPFYYNPKIGLVAFVRSGKKQVHFWGFQNRELKVYPLKAVNEGPERIMAGGEQVEAVRVYWTVDDFRSAFFKRTYWFRQSDGLYLKQKSAGGTFRELVSEEKD